MSNKSHWHKTEVRKKEGEEILVGWKGATGYLCNKNWNKLDHEKFHRLNIYEKSSGYTLYGRRGANENKLFTLEEYIKLRG